MSTEESAIIIEKVAYGVTLPDLKFGNSRPGVVEATLKPGHTLEDALDELDDRLNAWHRKKYPHLYQVEGKEFRHPMGNITMEERVEEAKRFQEGKSFHIPIISKDNEEPQEDTLSLIENAPDMAALASFKLLAGRNPDLYKAYSNRLKELA